MEPEGEKGIWNGMTMKRIQEGAWDPWIEEVVLGTTEDEGTIFADRLEVSLDDVSLPSFSEPEGEEALIIIHSAVIQAG